MYTITILWINDNIRYSMGYKDAKRYTNDILNSPAYEIKH